MKASYFAVHYSVSLSTAGNKQKIANYFVSVCTDVNCPFWYTSLDHGVLM